MDFHNGIFFRHLPVPLRYDTAKFESQNSEGAKGAVGEDKSEEECLIQGSNLSKSQAALP